MISYGSCFCSQDGRFSFTSYQGEDSGTSTPATTEKSTGETTSEGPAITADDIDFSDMKKKKKAKKKVDLDAFEKELSQSKAKSKTEDDEDDDEGPAPDGSHLDNIDEEELGDDPFARPSDAPVAVDAGNEAWLKSDRDYTYDEVLSTPILVS